MWHVYSVVTEWHRLSGFYGSRVATLIKNWGGGGYVLALLLMKTSSSKISIKLN
jgi:hypothetical protein